VRYSNGAAFVQFSLAGASGPGTVSGDTETFPNALPGVAAAFTAGNIGVKETLTLQDATAPHAFVYNVQMSPGLSARETADGGITFVDGSGQERFSFGPPFMSDSASPHPAISHAVSLKLVQTAAGLTVALAADSTWLADSGRKWPVVIDPTIVSPCQASVTTLSSNSATNGCTANLLVGYNLPNSGQLDRALTYFDFSSVPQNINVVSADMKFYLSAAQYGGSAHPTAVSANQVTRDWTTNATWTTYDGTNSWATPGGDITSTPSYTNMNVGPTAGFYHWYPVSLIQNWADGTISSNYGVILKEAGENDPLQLAFDSANQSVDRSYWPNVSIVYQSRTGDVQYKTPGGSGDTDIDQQHAYDTHQIDDRMHFHVNVANGNVLIHAHDLNIKGTGLDLVVDRFFNTQAVSTMDLGHAWSMGTGADVAMIVYNSSSVGFIGPTGYAVPFARSSDTGPFQSPSGVDATLIQLNGGNYQLTFQKTGEVYTFDPNGFSLVDSDKNGNAIHFSYTTIAGTAVLASIQDTQGRVATFSYNNPNNTLLITTMTDPSGRQSQYGYDTSSNLTSYTDPAGKVTHFAYNGSGNPMQIIDPDGNATNFGYDGSGRLTSISGGAGYSRTYAYNAGSTVVTDANNHQTTYTWDTKGRITGIRDALGNSPSLTYTAASNVQQYNDASGQVTTLAYDPNNNHLSTTDPTGAVTTWQYNDNSHPYYPTSSVDAQGNTVSYAYDANGNLLTITNGLASQNKLKFSYNGNGTVASTTDANGNATRYGYDGAGNLTSMTPPSPLGADTMTYDALSRLSTVKDGNGRTTTYSYDALDRPTQVVYADSTSVTFSYDANGNALSLVDNTGTTTFTYDAQNHQTRKLLPGGSSISYTYDGMGNLTTLVDVGGTTTYGYNAVNLLSTLTEPGGAQTTFTYDGNYHRTGTAYPNGVSIAMAYDNADHLTNITGKTGGTVLTSYTYTYINPQTGKATALRYGVTDAAGNITAYTYDVLNRLTEAKTTGRSPADYQYSYDGNGTRLNTSVNGANELSGVRYDQDGNTTADGRRYTYNAKNQTTTIDAGAILGMTYSGATQTDRVATAVGRGGSSYQYSLIGLSSANDGTGNTEFVRDARGTLTEERTPTGNYYYLFDGLGSVVGLTDSGGHLVDTYQYDPYGKTVTSTGSVANPWQYASAYLDSATGLYKMGLRYYDPATGRFTQQDPKVDWTNANGWNRYLYAQDDPINNTDPTGAVCVTDVAKGALEAAVGVATIVGASTPGLGWLAYIGWLQVGFGINDIIIGLQEVPVSAVMMCAAPLK
jgi:RHS repeat-associated protein